MTPEKDCEMQIIGLTEPVFVEFDTHVVLLTSGYLIKFDHLFKSGQVYDNNSDDEYPLTDGIKNAVIEPTG